MTFGGGKALCGTLGSSGALGAWGGGAGGVSQQRRQERPTSCLPPGGIRRRVPNNLNLTFRNDLISYLSKHYLILKNVVNTLQDNISTGILPYQTRRLARELWRATRRH